MFYGYGPELDDYDETKAWELANKLSEEFDYPTMDGNGPRPIWRFSHKGPYIEVDGAFGGVKIRKLTYLSDEEVNRIQKRADEIFLEVMSVENDTT